MPRLQLQNLHKATQDELLKQAKNVVSTEVQRCTIFESQRLDNLPIFDKHELVLGRVVGRGGFAVCQEITAIKLKPSTTTTSPSPTPSTPSTQSSELSNSSSHSRSGRKKKENSSKKESTATSYESERERLARRVYAKKGDKYVIKHVNHESLHTDKSSYIKGTIDLALETHYLASLNHDHILSLRGLAKTTPFDANGGYFIILDHLNETLAKRLCSWMHQHRATKGVTGLLTGGKRKVTKLYLERLLVALDIADAMAYLHQRYVCYRDLKPDNCGFAQDSTLKLFDFGLAREMRDADRVPGSDCYLMTPFTGAIRYMAPEVGLRKPYNHKADVYAWSMLLHYIIALEPPMGAYTPKMFIDRVFQQGYRPAVKDKWPATLRDLMRRCWSEDIDERPEFSEILRILKQEIGTVDPDAGSCLSEPLSEERPTEKALVESVNKRLIVREHSS